MTADLPLTRRSAVGSPIELLLTAAARGERCALVTVLGIEGGAPRRRGAQLAVTASGEVAGSLSGGCLDAAVIAEAQAVLAAARSRRIRFGLDSPYVDVVLPCGSGLDLQFDGAIDTHTLTVIAACVARRQVFTLAWSAPDRSPQCHAGADILTMGVTSGEAVVMHPNLRLVVAGASDNLRAMCRLAVTAGIDTVALATDRALLDELSGYGVDTVYLASDTQLPAVVFDAHTAALTLFHEHDAELVFLRAALAGPAFLVAAMGSVRAHAQRIERLRGLGVADLSLQRLRGPFGLLPRARDPQELAISMLAELFQVYREHCFPKECHF
ncbi:MAG: XdhC family protein [Ahniella sp.]|nr:XdhC family protein [Ahniella sp.]